MTIKEIYIEIMLHVWTFIGSKMLGFDFVDIYAPHKKHVTAVTFSNDESYINKVTSINKLKGVNLYGKIH